MESARAVTADPIAVSRQGRLPAQPCFACPTDPNNDPKQGTTPVRLTEAQILSRATVNTGEYRNPFKDLSLGSPSVVYLCTKCRDKKRGWTIICNPKKVGVGEQQRALQAWKTRCRNRRTSNNSYKQKLCHLCRTTTDNLPSSSSATMEISSDDQMLSESLRQPTIDWTLLRVAQSDATVQEKFVNEFISLSGCQRSDITTLLQDPSEYRMCYGHLNHSRYAQQNAFSSSEDSVGKLGGVCVFHNLGCLRKTKRLRKLPSLMQFYADSAEEAVNYEEEILQHTQGKLSAVEAQGKYCCLNCMYLLFQGKRGAAPVVPITVISSPTDRWLFRAICSCLESIESGQSNIKPEVSSVKIVNETAMSLQTHCITPFKEHFNFKVIPFNEVLKCREALQNMEQEFYGVEPKAVCSRTVESTLRHVLAAKGITLLKMSHKMRCYVSNTAYRSVLSKGIRENASFSSLSVEMRNELYSEVQNIFVMRRELYWKGEWTLNEEISRIPSVLWLHSIIDMSSATRKTTWRASARALGKRCEDIFPLSNAANSLPFPSLEQCLLSRDGEVSRYDIQLCIRTLKVIEQVVFSRSNSVSGPITTCMSIAGIMEMTPSTVSVMNALGLALSYPRMERYRFKLISEREKQPRGAWSETPVLHECVIPVCQFDNWDIMPLHAVKCYGKSMPKVNGSLLQAIVCPPKLGGDETAEYLRRVKDSSWKNHKLLGDRSDFIKKQHCDEYSRVLNEFNDIAFGAVWLKRNALVGGSEGLLGGLNIKGGDFYTIQDDALNFRTLLLSTFLPHGGENVLTCALNDQQVVYVDVSFESAANILTVRRFIAQLSANLTPGEPGCPRYVVFEGDEPTYKMAAEMWLQSFRKQTQKPQSGDKTHTTNRQMELHEWLIPFPGFFHMEKQAFYPLCKEIFDGVGLQELAKLTGLSKSQTDNILRHSHARNNRAVLFNVACAMPIHISDIILEEEEEFQNSARDIIKDMNQKRVVDESNRE